MALPRRGIAALAAALFLMTGTARVAPAQAASASPVTFVTYLQAVPASTCSLYCPQPGFTQSGIAVSASPVEQWSLAVHYPGGCYGTAPECEGTWSMTGSASDALSGHWIRWEGCWAFDVTKGKGRFAGDTAPMTTQAQFPYLAGSYCAPQIAPNGFIAAGLLTLSPR